MDGQKNVGKALGTNDIRALASNWTLAGDVGLLAHLEQFSEHILKKTQETQTSMAELLNSYEETSTTINNVTNQFLALQNSQFVENRVYDDETPTDEKKIETNELNNEAEERLMLARYKEAVEKGIKLLDTHFEEVQLPPSSDSDEEDFSSGNGALVWRSKNPYSSKRFPLLIGSAEWWADDNVGLGDYEENVDSERVLSESDSDMEAEHNVEKRIRMSSSSSIESEPGINKKMKMPQSTSGYEDIFRSGDNDIFGNSSNLFLKKGDDLFDEPDNIFGEKESIPSLKVHTNDSLDTNTFQEKVEKSSLFNDDAEEETKQPKEIQPTSAKQRKIENAFTKELSAKLGTIASERTESPSPETAKVPVKSKLDKISSALLDDDGSDDLFSTKITPLPPEKKTNNLFSDLDDDQLFNSSDSFFSKNEKKGGLFDHDFSSSTKSSVSNTSQAISDNKNTKSGVSTSGNLFDGDLFGDVDDDDTLFSSSKPTVVQSQSTIKENKNLPPKVKFSTPSDPRNSLTLGASDDLFGTLSAVHSNDDSNVNASDGSLNAARLLDDDLSQDLGFNDQTGDISHNQSVQLPTGESPNLFQPQLSSTRRISQETSDYKTQKIFSDNEHHTDSSNMPYSQDNSKDKMGHNEKVHFSRAQSEASKSKGLFEEDGEDLFSSESSKPSKSMFADDVLSNSKSNAPLFKKSDLGLFEDDDNSLFADSLKQPDSISVSSSRSSLFDDTSIAKSTLASVFDKEKNLKLTEDLFGVSDDDGLFNGKKVNDDLFAPTKSATKHKATSLFNDIEDSDNLFSSSSNQILFSENDKSENLFSAKNVFEEEKSEVNLSKPINNPVKISNVHKEENREIDDDQLFVKPLPKPQKPLNISREEKQEIDDDQIFVKPLPKPQKPLYTSKEEKLEDKNDNFFSKPLTEPKAETENLFSEAKSYSSKSASNPLESKSLFSDLDDEDNLFSSKTIEKPLVAKVEPEKKPEPPKSLNIKKNVVDTSEPDGGVISAVKPKKIGKLNIPSSLNINPAALLPGAKSEKKEEKSVTINVDQPVESSPNLLKCTNKDRVKIKVQRRPQSRKARQAALRKSGIDFGSEETGELKNDALVENSTGESSSSIFHSAENSPDTLFSSSFPSNPLSPSTDEEDYFNVPELDINFEKEDQSIFRSNLNNLKNSTNKSDDNLLFDGAPVLSPVDSTKDIIKTIDFDNKLPKKDLFADVSDLTAKLKKQKIFDDDNNDLDSDDDSLFKNTDSLFSKKSEASKDTLFQESKPKPVLPKNSLFDDSPDVNSDLFKGKHTNPVSVKVSKEVIKDPLKKPVLDKSKESFVDPLGLMSNPE